jgi:hypothetical protein
MQCLKIFLPVILSISDAACCHHPRSASCVMPDYRRVRQQKLQFIWINGGFRVTFIRKCSTKNICSIFAVY